MIEQFIIVRKIKGFFFDFAGLKLIQKYQPTSSNLI